MCKEEASKYLQDLIATHKYFNYVQVKMNYLLKRFINITLLKFIFLKIV